jgi:hypothetical protein
MKAIPAISKRKARQKVSNRRSKKMVNKDLLKATPVDFFIITQRDISPKRGTARFTKYPVQSDMNNILAGTLQFIDS